MKKIVIFLTLSFFAFSLNAGVFDFLKKATPIPSPVKEAKTYLQKGHTYSVSYFNKHHYVLNGTVAGIHTIVSNEYDQDECYDTLWDLSSHSYYIVGKLKTYHAGGLTWVTIDGEDFDFHDTSTHYDE